MGSSVVDKLDAEIAELEAKHGFDSSETQPSVSAEDSPTTATAGDSQASTEIENLVMPTVGAQSIPPSETGVEPKKKREDYKKRWKNFKAYHDSEKYKDNKIKAEAFQKIADLTKEVDLLKGQLQENDVSTPRSVKDLVSQEELDIIGDEGVSSIDKITRKAIAEAVNPLKEQLDKAHADSITATEREAQAARENASKFFLKRLGELVPDFQSLDTDTGFEEYLKGTDPASGASRFSLFKRAQDSGDVGRVADFFNGYKKTRKPTATETLSRKITPQATGGYSPEQTAIANGGSKQVYKMSDYNAFMADVNKGKKYAGRQSEVDAIEHEFDMAFMEGRIVNA